MRAPPSRSVQLPRSRARRALERLAALALGTLAGLLSVELALWATRAATDAGELRRAVPATPPAPGERRILCVGDSNTFGVHLAPEQSYPGQLQTLLDRAPGQPWRVVNLGTPGRNSAEVRAELAGDLERHRAEIVLFLAGVNNTWSPARRHLWSQPDGEDAAAGLEALLQESRTLGVVRMLADRVRRRWLDDPPRAEVRDGAEGARTGERLRETLRVDLTRVHALCREADAALVLLTYPIREPAFVPRDVNAPVEAFAATTGAPLVDLHGGLTALFDRYGEGTLAFPDRHANALGNYEVARRVLERLIAAGLLEPRPEWRAVPSLDELFESCGATVAGSAPEWLELELRGPPEARWYVALEALVRGPEGERAQLVEGQRGVLLAAGDVAARGDERAWRGRLNDAGTRRVRLPRPLALAEPAAVLREDERLVGWRLLPTVFVDLAGASCARPARPLDLPVSDS